MNLHSTGTRKRIEKEKGFGESFEAAGNVYLWFILFIKDIKLFSAVEDTILWFSARILFAVSFIFLNRGINGLSFDIFQFILGPTNI